MISKKKKIFTESAMDFPAKIGNSSAFFDRKQVISNKKKRSSSQKRHEIQCQSTKDTNLGLDLHSSSPEPVKFFGAQSSAGGAQLSFGGARPRYAPRGAGCALTSRTCIDDDELIVRKYLLLWWSFCVLEVTFYSLI